MRRVVQGAAGVALMVALASCAADAGEPPQETPAAVGTVASVVLGSETVSLKFTPDEGYEYFDGTTFVVDDTVPVTGAVDNAHVISAGDRIEVWTDTCAESFPVQCVVTAIDVAG
ncbi:hypothetical protein ON058_10585 [Demequina sp. B12]|uniref:hypothetical protein n=1 Tax=Demequina sp. B12 TaxID=2992757 RepID=UPI00237BC182|nr:hypothetical protein [Demequina sp. B12]MDE0573856.1 hypothetical protein [Demequina sp. B12]